VERRVDRVITQLDAVLKEVEDHRDEDIVGANLLRRHPVLPMLVKKCDSCKKEINIGEEITAGLGWDRYSLCARCGKPIIAFLRKHKLLQPAKMAG